MTVRLLALAGLLLLGACGTYAPPEPGMHVNHGDPRAALRCDYGAQTAMAIKSWRCHERASLTEQERQARDTMDSINIPPPPPP